MGVREGGGGGGEEEGGGGSTGGGGGEVPSRKVCRRKVQSHHT